MIEFTLKYLEERPESVEAIQALLDDGCEPEALVLSIQRGLEEESMWAIRIENDPAIVWRDQVNGETYDGAIAARQYRADTEGDHIEYLMKELGRGLTSYMSALTFERNRSSPGFVNIISGSTGGDCYN